MESETRTHNFADDQKVFLRVDHKDNGTPVYFYQYDNHLGSSCLELNENGAIISYEEYHPFGTTSYQMHGNNVEVSLKRYKYCGKERDEETGLYYYGARYYAAWLCRFVNVDPLQHKFDWVTPYNYAENRPISGIDLWGLQWVSVVDQQDIKHVSVNVNFTDSTEGELSTSGLSIADYKAAINEMLDTVLQLSTNGRARGQVLFNGGNEKDLGQVIPSFEIFAKKPTEETHIMIGGVTGYQFAGVNIYNKRGELKPINEFAIDAVHELLHTLRIDHPFEKTQATDTELVHEGGDNYSTTDKTNPNIFYNIMNYGIISIDGKKLSELWKNTLPQYLSGGQIDFLFKEIDLQEKGKGLFNYNKNISEDENNKNYLDFQTYWSNFPGKDVPRHEK